LRGDGAIVFVSESPGKARLNFTIDSRPTEGQPFEIDIAKDGSGSGERPSVRFGPITYQIFAGSGKRLIKKRNERRQVPVDVAVGHYSPQIAV
jgi:hypothetical protein